MRRQARLFALADHLRGRRTAVTASQLAERFGVTLRTIYRDLDTLREGHFPLKSDRGPGGGYALDKHHALPPINLNAREAALLLALGTHAVQSRLVPFVETLQSALDRVRAALSDSAQRELLETLPQLRFVGVPAPAAKPRVRAAVEEAWFTRAPLTVHYRRRDQSLSVRTVHVESVVLERGGTLLNVVDVEDGERRQYNLAHVEAARVMARA